MHKMNKSRVMIKSCSPQNNRKSGAANQVLQHWPAKFFLSDTKQPKFPPGETHPYVCFRRHHGGPAHGQCPWPGWVTPVCLGPSAGDAQSVLATFKFNFTFAISILENMKICCFRSLGCCLINQKEDCENNNIDCTAMIIVLKVSKCI